MINLISFIIVVGIGAWCYQKYGYMTLWYLKFFRTSFVAQRFYTTYPNVFRDIAFDPNLTSRTDVYAPTSGTNHPVLIFIHGGGWHRYRKETFASVAMKLLPENLVVVVPDYTLHPDGDYQLMTQEVAAVVYWTLTHIRQYRGDPQRVVISGHSAGAHLMMLAMADPHFLTTYGYGCQDICGIIGLSGVYDTAAQDHFGLEKGVSTEILRSVMGGVDNFAQSSPLSYVHAGLPPLLLIHGALDETVPLKMSQTLDQTINDCGGQSALIIYEEANHTDFLFEAFSQSKSRLVRDMTDFVYTVTTPSTEANLCPRTRNA